MNFAGAGSGGSAVLNRTGVGGAVTFPEDEGAAGAGVATGRAASGGGMAAGGAAFGTSCGNGSIGRNENAVPAAGWLLLL